MGSAVRCGSVHLTGGIECHRPPRPEAIVSRGKTMQNVFGGWLQLKNDPTSITRARSAGAARDGRAIEVAVGIKSDPAVRVLSLTKAVKTIEHRFLPRQARSRRELERRAACVRSPDHGRTVEVALAIDDESRCGIAAVVAAGKTKEHLLASRSGAHSCVHRLHRICRRAERRVRVSAGC